jgi:anthranilate phosphoribosyltransferase
MDGLDEVSIIGKTKISELKDGEVSTYMVQPEDFGLGKANLKDILGMDVDESAVELLRFFMGERERKRICF